MSKVDGVTCQSVKTTQGSRTTCPNVDINVDIAIFTPSDGLVLHWAVYGGKNYVWGRITFFKIVSKWRIFKIFCTSLPKDCFTFFYGRLNIVYQIEPDL